MTNYIALLRGINIGGHRVKMEHLRKLFQEAGVAQVRSYIQTGNIFFATDETDRAALTERIEQHLCAALGYDVPVFLRTNAELEEALQLNPFQGFTATEDTRFLITFIPQPLSDDLKFPFVPPKNDYEILHATAGEVFSLLRLVDGRPSNPALFIEKAGKMKTTSRFYATAGKILQAAQEANL